MTFAINLTAEDGSVVVSDLSLVDGTVELQSRIDFSGAEVCADDGGGNVTCVTTGAAGVYELWLPAGTYTVTATMGRFLDGEKGGVVVSAGGSASLSPVRLLGGDTNDDCIVNILDLSFMGARYGSSCGDPGYEARADINNDCDISILDLAVSGSNYQQTCPVTWP